MDTFDQVLYNETVSSKLFFEIMDDFERDSWKRIERDWDMQGKTASEVARKAANASKFGSKQFRLWFEIFNTAWKIEHS